MGVVEDSQIAYLIHGRVASLNKILRECLPRVEDERLKRIIKELLFGEIVAMDIVGGTRQRESEIEEVGEILGLETIPTEVCDGVESGDTDSDNSNSQTC